MPGQELVSGRFGGFSDIRQNYRLEAQVLTNRNNTLNRFVQRSQLRSVTLVLAPGTLSNLSGNSLRQAPEWTAFVRGEYDFMLGNGGALTFGAQASYKSEQFYTEFNDDITSQDDYTLVDLNLRYTAPNEQLTVNLWGRNVTDELVRSTGYDNALGRTITYTYLPPATYGITIGYDF